ncbi:MAG: hypothetical protein HYY23_09070 [Verrucomicrobia bacterium]|nr:hypothetical protein [Verrucomicrobiota bacterium]
MAWRIHDSVKRGEIDNRERGVVRGKIWLEGKTEPVVLELRGNAATDLAGCLLTFSNPGETIPLPRDAGFNSLQRGTVGDLTASRKVRVLDLPVEEAYRRKKEGLDVPEHMANCVYLEWFSAANGRVVIESTDYQLAISPPAWRLTPDEENQRRVDAEAGFNAFMQKLSAALENAKHEPPEEKEWDEFDYEKLLRESDARTDKYSELLDKYMDHPDRDRIIAKEMGWSWIEEALDSEKGRSSPESDNETEDEANDPREVDREADEEPFALEVPDDLPPLEPDPATEGVDWVREEDGGISHPLSLRAFNSSMDLWHKCKELGLGKLDDDDLGTLLTEFQITGAKLAGALDSLAYGRGLKDGAFIVACLKRALSYLHAAQAALEKVAPKKLLPGEIVSTTRTELFQIREEILRLMEEFRNEAH